MGSRRPLITLLAISMVGNVLSANEENAKQLSTNLNPSNWSPYDELISPKLTINPKASFELLKVVEEECGDRLAGLFQDKASRNKCKHAEELVAACEIKSENCDDYEREYEKIQRIINSERMHPNIATLLEHRKGLQYDLCKKGLIARLKRYVDELPANLDYNFLLLKKHIFMVSGKDQYDKLYRIDDQSLLSQGILKHLKYQNDNLFAKISKEGELGKKILLAEFENSIEKPCKMIVRRLESPIRVFKMLSIDEYMYPRLEAGPVTWLENSNLCDQILKTNKENLFAVTYKLLLAEAPMSKSPNAWLKRYYSNPIKPKFN